jgi:acetoin utilization protein AcuB
MHVAGYMTRQPTTISSKDTLQMARERMQARGCRRLPVVDGGVLTGIISDRDLGSHTGHFQETRVTAAMTENPITVTSRSSMRDAALQMLQYKLDSLPVVDNGELVGIVTTSDVLKAFIEGSVNVVRG